MGAVCNTSSPESIIMPVVHPEADRNQRHAHPGSPSGNALRDRYIAYSMIPGNGVHRVRRWRFAEVRSDSNMGGIRQRRLHHWKLRKRSLHHPLGKHRSSIFRCFQSEKQKEWAARARSRVRRDDGLYSGSSLRHQKVCNCGSTWSSCWRSSLHQVRQTFPRGNTNQRPLKSQQQ